VRRELLAALDKKVEQNVTIVFGSRTSTEDLRKLRPEDCEEIFLLGETEELDHDSLNIKCLELFVDIIKKSRKTTIKRCHVLFEYQSTYAVFQCQKIKEFTCLNVEPFNMEEMWARKVFVSGNYLEGKSYPPLDRKPITPDSDKYVHLVVVGASRMGIAMAIEAARIGHYANFSKQKTRITIIDATAEEQMNILRSRYSAFMEAIEVKLNGKKMKWCGELEEYMYVTLDFIEGRIESADIRKILAEWSVDKQRLLTIAVCFHHPPTNLAVGLYLPNEVYANNIPVLINQETSGNILHSFNSEGLYKNVYAFGMTSEGYETALNDDGISQYVQYIYYNAWDFENKKPTEDELSNNWINEGVVEKWSNRYNADTIPTKLRAAGFEIQCSDDIAKLNEAIWENYDKYETLLAEIEHNRWNVERLLAGYRYFNETRKQTVFDTIKKDESLKNKIENLYTNKNVYHNMLKKHYDMLQNVKTEEDKAQPEIVKNEIKVFKKNEIDDAKKIIKAAFYHECITPYDDLSDTDKFYDLAIARGIKWIVKNLYQQKNNSHEQKS
jgi:hypothetical protein